MWILASLPPSPNPYAPGAKALRHAVHIHDHLVNFCIKTLGKPLSHSSSKLGHTYLSILLCTFYIKLVIDRAFRLVVLSSFAYTSSKFDWLEFITWIILANNSCRLRKQMNIDLQVERLYCSVYIMISYNWTVEAFKFYWSWWSYF